MTYERSYDRWIAIVAELLDVPVFDVDTDDAHRHWERHWHQRSYATLLRMRRQ